MHCEKAKKIPRNLKNSIKYAYESQCNSSKKEKNRSIRQLKEKNIPIYFEKENINTLDAKGEVLITIMASLAQQESQSISQNVRMGIQYQY